MSSLSPSVLWDKLSHHRGTLFRLALGVLLAWALFELPLEPGGIPRARAALGISLDAVVIVGVVVAARLLPGRARLDTGRWQWIGSGWAWVGGFFWALLLVVEMARAATLHATNNDLPLYDAILLAHHLYILGRDLYGLWAQAGLLLLALAPVLLWGTATLALGRIEAGTRGLGRVHLLLLCLAIAIAGAISDREAYSTRFLAPPALDNARRSLALWREVYQEIERGPSPELLATDLTDKPDVVFYIVESYGQIAQAKPEMNDLWAPAMASFEERIERAGFHAVTGLDNAPVHGGRSWIADASLMLGLHVAHESTYEHLMTMTDALPHLPGFFAARGYTTVLIKPKDRERPGVRLENPFGFQKTVFAEDLDYRGPYYGWGEIPDQFSIERVEEEVMGPIEAPVFAYFHLVSSHMPWADAPPLTDRWEDWQDEPGERKPVFVERSFIDELRMRFSRWKRTLRTDRPGKEPTSEQPHRYVENVLYDIEVAVRRLERGVDKPRLMIVMGDHQPPLLAPGSGPEVIVHVFASDDRWLEAFREAGFQDGMVPPPPPAKMAHRDLFPVIVQALSGK